MNGISYLAGMLDPSSDNPFRNIPIDTGEREKKLLETFPGDYTPGHPLVATAYEELEELLETPTNRYCKGIESLLLKLTTYMDTAILDDTKDGNLDTILRIVERGGTVLKQYQAASKLQEDEEKKMRGKQQRAYDM